MAFTAFQGGTTADKFRSYILFEKGERYFENCSNEERRFLRLAGLLHDIGHYPHNRKYGTPSG
ncbi:MAG: HD domain-containing protein [Oscillibacter sp.]|nr:HD domain-containing protein [Oscillibacter sp.]